ncbi:MULTISPECIES: hypothetical protein [Streptomyces]|uniref:HTTM domain-containing protein n=1 Tax=Streptomyces dengpaensis TaxID=2049881 RepID=A0ABM6SN09_9ACTN|nr:MULTISPECIES: hypothetical protein [Streptomyces]AVH55864.1 hypothetical protein C4B68_08870 [Streptomyces dengpaensis]PIB12115.1 hypothetical protein B1C81_02805 [Streptomyces sp. HG99]
MTYAWVATPAPLDALGALGTLDLVVRLAAGASLVSCAELLTSRRQLAPGGWLDWEILRLVPRYVRRSFPAVLANHCFVHPRYQLLLWAQSVLSAALFVWPRLWPVALCVAVLHVAEMTRDRWSSDGADELIVIVLVAAAIGYQPGSRVAATACLAFLSLQLTIGYATAGLSKAQSATWRSGYAVVGILRTTIYGDPRLARILARHSLAASLLAWTVILGELALGAIWFLPGVLIPPFLACGLLFHVGCARLMGLNTFLWAFPALYPAALAIPELRATAYAHAGQLLFLVLPLAAGLCGLWFWLGHRALSSADVTRRGTPKHRSPTRVRPLRPAPRIPGRQRPTPPLPVEERT